MIRAVLDTNILLSALLQPKSVPSQVLVTVLSRETALLCASAEIYAEYDEVLRRPRFNRSETEIAATLRAIRELALWVRPARTVHACTDQMTTNSLSVRKPLARTLSLPVT